MEIARERVATEIRSRGIDATPEMIEEAIAKMAMDGQVKREALERLRTRRDLGKKMAEDLGLDKNGNRRVSAAKLGF